MKMKKLIGKGAFTKCYQIDEKTVQLESVDPVKECMSLGWFPTSRYFPKVKRLDRKVYEMEYYPRVTSLKASLKPEQYALYNELNALSISRYGDSRESYEQWANEFKRLKNVSVKKALLGALSAITNYGTDIHFEISPRNVAVKNGNLILLDCFFLQSALDEVRK